jgi:hypothetical protein
LDSYSADHTGNEEVVEGVAIGGDEAICIGFYLIDVCDGTGILLYGE